MTYDPERHVVYTLEFTDEVRVGPHTSKFVSLRAHNLATDESVTLASWPHIKRYPGLYLTLLEGGDLALTASATTHHAVFRFAPQERSLRFRGLHTGLGKIPVAPVLGEHDLVLPVQIGSKLSYATVATYRWGVPCAEL